ncbi:MAG: M23 family metallopeptidase [Bacteroidetes bacterium]|nr:M23 family metallopeptidase [Bacteroidota bacterium]
MVLLLFPFNLGSAIIRQDAAQTKSSPKKFPQGYFVEPTDSSLSIAGNFGEIRPNHFHAGIDIKTGGREGAFIYAAADGYVSRIKISPWGYGKCIYITHPNGYVTVYGHLQRLYGKIAKYLELEQYRLEQYEVELFPDSNLLRVKQCDTVAISGNTGGSQSPHLHFEIRDAVTENAYNPFLFGFRIHDTVPPKLMTLAIYPVEHPSYGVYPANDSSSVNGKNVPKKIKVYPVGQGQKSYGVYGSKGKYKLSSAEKITVSGDIGFGIETYDYANIKEAGKLGAYSVDLYIDGHRIYYHELNEISFDESRYVNSLIDYAEEAKSNKEIQKCFREENNMLSIYQCMVNEGLFRFDDSLSHPVKFVVKDFFGNTSSLEFKVRSSEKKIKTLPTPNSQLPTKMKCSDLNKYETENIKIEISPCALYSDIDFDYSMSKDTLPGTFSPVHTIHKEVVPLQVNYSLSIKTKYLSKNLQSKATIVLLDGKNNMTDQKGSPSLTLPEGKGTARPSSPPSGELVGALWLTTQTRYFGRFTVALDTVAPTIKPYNIYNGKNMAKAKTISIIISDNLTGIKSYRATIDGKWVLMEYEPKKALLFYEFQTPTLISPKGGEAPSSRQVGTGEGVAHTFVLTVTDGKNNVSTYKVEFVR